MKRARKQRHLKEIDSLREVERLADRARLFIRVIAGLLVLFFAWLQLRNMPLVAIVEGTKPEFLRRFTLAMYYICFVFGASFDVNVQERVYMVDPQRGRMPWVASASAVIFGLVAAVLMLVSDNAQYLAMSLAALVFANIVGWRVIIVRTRPMIRESSRLYMSRREFARLEQLNSVESYIAGAWQWHRFCAMSLMIAGLLVLSFSDEARRVLSMAIRHVGSGLSEQTIFNLLPDVMLLIYLVIAESWIWGKRVVTASSLKVIDELNGKYASS